MTEPSAAEIARRYAAVTVADTAFPVVIRSASGCRLEDTEGNTYIDFISGYGVVSTGWQRSEVLTALESQARTLCFAPQWLPTREALQLAEELLALAPRSVRAVARATGGAEANEIALKAHFAARGGKVLTIGLAYHGGTTRTLALSDGPAFGLPPTPEPPSPRVPPAYCYRCPFGKSRPECSLECVQAIEDAVQADQGITGVLLEPVIGSGGAIVPPPEYFAAISELCTRRNLILILDEVMTGCGRVGAFLAAEAFGLQPDAVTLAKGMGGGYVPIGAALLSGELADALSRYEDVSATLAWTPLACAATLANLRIIRDENLAVNARDTGAKLLAALRELFERVLPVNTGDVRGMGLLIGVELVKDRATKEPAVNLAKRIILRCLRAGLMIGSSWDWHTLIILPPLTLDEATMNEALSALEGVLKRVSRTID